MDKKEYFYWNDLPILIGDVFKLDNTFKDKFIKDWERAIWTKNIQDKEQKLANIKDLISIKVVLPSWIIDRLKEVADHYVKGQWLSTIVVSGIISEFITYYFIEKYINENGINNLIEHSKKLSNQKGRINLLKIFNLVKEGNTEKLDSIRKKRNKYIHLNKVDDDEESKEDALEVLNSLIEFLNSERPIFTNYNINRIKKFNDEVKNLQN